MIQTLYTFIGNENDSLTKEWGIKYGSQYRIFLEVRKKGVFLIQAHIKTKVGEIVCPYTNMYSFGKNWLFEKVLPHRWTSEEAKEMSRKAKEKKEQIKRGKKFRKKCEVLGIGIEETVGIPVKLSGSAWTATPDFKKIVKEANRRSLIRLIIIDVIIGLLLGYFLSIW